MWCYNFIVYPYEIYKIGTQNFCGFIHIVPVPFGISGANIS